MAAGLAGEQRVARVLSAYPALPFVGGFVFSVPGRSETVQVDHVLRGADRLYVIETKNWAGPVTARERGSWQSGRGAKCKSYGNPLEQARRQAGRLSLLTGVTVQPIVVLAGGDLDGTEPASLRNMVVSIRGLPHLLGELGAQRAPGAAVAEQMLRAWNIVRAEERAMDQPRRAAEHVERLRQRRGQPSMVPSVRTTSGWAPRLVFAAMAAAFALAGTMVHGRQLQDAPTAIFSGPAAVPSGPLPAAVPDMAPAAPVRQAAPAPARHASRHPHPDSHG